MNQTKWLNIVGAIDPPDYSRYNYLITPGGEVLRTSLQDLYRLDWANSIVLCKVDILPKRNYSILKDGSIIEVVLGNDFDISHVGINPWKKILKRL